MSQRNSEATASPSQGRRFKVLKNIDNLSTGKHWSPGEVADDIPEEDIGWLLEDGAIEEVRTGGKASR